MQPTLTQIPLETPYTLRAPHENMERVIDCHKHGFGLLGGERYGEVLNNIENGKDDPGKQTGVINHITFTLHKQIVAMHGMGHPIEAIKSRLQDLIAFKRWTDELQDDEVKPQVNQNYRKQIYALAVLTLPADDLEYFFWTPLLANTKPKDRMYILDVLHSAYRQNFTPARKYSRDKFAYIWADPLHKALAQNPDKKEAALAKSMEGWPDRVKKFVPLDWKPWEEEQYKYITDDGRKIYAHPNFDFAFEIALAVCAYDLDDTSFRDHPYYPRDLVDYYRDNVRNTRDAWRAPGAGPTLDLEPYEVKLIDLSKKKAKGFRRWLDIASNGDPDGVGDVLTELTNLRKIKKLGQVVGKMDDYGIALLVDLKDDETCETELLRLIKSRNIDATYTVPKTKYPAGPGRCEELLAHASAWLADNGHRLITLMPDGDWDAVIIDQKWEQEFRELSENLGVEL